MPDITIDAGKAERIIAQILRDDAEMLPASANKMAEVIARRLYASMAAPTNSPLQGHRLIPSSPPLGSDFREALGQKLADVNDRVAHELWKLVYERGKDLPGTMVDPTRL